MSRKPSPWTGIADAMSFAFACQQVIALRLMRIAQGGPRSQHELTRMVTEKAAAAVEAQFAAALGMVTGDPARATAAATDVYRRAVNANGRRLRKP